MKFNLFPIKVFKFSSDYTAEERQGILDKNTFKASLIASAKTDKPFTGELFGKSFKIISTGSDILVLAIMKQIILMDERTS